MTHLLHLCPLFDVTAAASTRRGCGNNVTSYHSNIGGNSPGGSNCGRSIEVGGSNCGRSKGGVGSNWGMLMGVGGSNGGCSSMGGPDPVDDLDSLDDGGCSGEGGSTGGCESPGLTGGVGWLTTTA